MAAVVIQPPPGQHWTLTPPSRLDASADFIADAAADGGSETSRLLVSVFASSADAALRLLLDAFKSGIEMQDESSKNHLSDEATDDDSPGTNIVLFTVEGSLVSTLGEASALEFVVRPDWPTGAEAFTVAPSQLREALIERLRSLSDSGNAQVEVWDLQPSVSQELFGDRVFHEFRFGVVDPNFDRAGPHLTKIAAEFIRFLSARSIPIAYLHYPTGWRSAQQSILLDAPASVEDASWLRIAVGLPYGFAEPLEVQLFARRVAMTHSAILALYNPAAGSEMMGQRFELAFLPDKLEFARDEPRASIAASDEPRGYVFVEGGAQPGFVNSMLDAYPRTAEAGISGGSMAVLCGHTVAAWETPQSVANDFAEALQAQTVTGAMNARVEPFIGTHLQRRAEPAAAARRQTIWVGWRALDRPGVIHDLLEYLDRASRTIAAPSPQPTGPLCRVEYMISRVLSEARTCAGKLKLSVPHHVAELMIADGSHRNELTELLDREGWNPANEDWRQEMVTISAEEPGESPWATLTFEGLR